MAKEIIRMNCGFCDMIFFAKIECEERFFKEAKKTAIENLCGTRKEHWLKCYSQLSSY